MSSSIGAVYQPVNYRVFCPWCHGPAKATGKKDGNWILMVCEKAGCDGKNKWWA